MSKNVRFCSKDMYTYNCKKNMDRYIKILQDFAKIIGICVLQLLLNSQM